MKNKTHFHTRKLIVRHIIQPLVDSTQFMLFTLIVQAIVYLIEDAYTLKATPHFATYTTELLGIAFIAGQFPKKTAGLLRSMVAALIWCVALVDVYCYLKIGSVFGPTMAMLISETNGSEASEFFDSYVWQPETLKVLGIFIVPLLAIPLLTKLFRRYIYRRFTRECRIMTSALMTILLCISIAGIGTTIRTREYMFATSDPGTIERDMSDELFDRRCTPPFRFIASIYTQHLANLEVMRIEKNVASSVIDSCSFLSPNIVLIIGESYNRGHASLYGYEKQTTPRMDSLANKKELFAFSNVVSCWNMTSYSFKNMLSMHSLDQEGAWCDTPLFPALIKKAGYHVDFLTNQFAMQKDLDVHDFSGGFFLNSQKLSDNMFNCRNERRYEFDESLVSHYDTLGCNDETNKFVIFHLMGQHFSYNKRYPRHRAHFKSNHYNRPDIKNQKNVRIVAWYDNATLYNDSVVCEIIKRFSNKDAIVIYLPDHGEEVFDEMQRFARCVWDEVTPAIARQEFVIPMMIWCSRQYRTNHPDVIRQIRKARKKPFMTDDISHMLLYLAGIHCKEYSESRNLLSPNYNSARRRMLRNKYDCDSLLSIKK